MNKGQGFNVNQRQYGTDFDSVLDDISKQAAETKLEIDAAQCELAKANYIIRCLDTVEENRPVAEAYEAALLKERFNKDIEHGSSAWGKEKDMKPYTDKNFFNNMILSASIFLSMNMYKTHRNGHAWAAPVPVNPDSIIVDSGQSTHALERLLSMV